ncbi:MAG: T9SS type A sorting domain-containing protein [Saprospiraceae bacterium]|nr:T9SS type A sorting domain-containing protein [Saprospiraceae bacterium]
MLKNKYIFLIFLILSFNTGIAQLSGTYTIGINGNFASFTAAVNALTINGVNAPVVFNVSPGTYYEQITIPQITGTSFVNTIIFQSSSLDSTSVILSYATTSWTNDYVVELDGADYICFRKMKMKSVSTGAYVGVFIIKNSANNNKIEHCILECPYIYSPNSSVVSNISTSNNLRDTGNIILNNRIINGRDGITFYGETNNYETLNRIEKNHIINSFYHGIGVNYQDSIQIVENIIEQSPTGFSNGAISVHYTNTFLIFGNNINIHLNSQGSYAISVSDCLGSIIISNNKISSPIISVPLQSQPKPTIDCRYTKGRIEITNNTIYTYSNSGNIPAYSLYMKYCAGTISEPILIANNIFSHHTVSGTPASCICLQNDTNVNLYNNSLNMTVFGTVYSNNNSFYQTACSNLNIVNNIFVNNAGGICAYHATPSAVAYSDYNNYYTNGNYLAYWNGNKSNLSAFKSASLKDTNSLSIPVNFVSNTDLHLTSLDSGLINKGFSLSGITKDIDNESRLYNPPDIGADEFQIPIDFQLTDITINPNNECYSSGETIKCVLRNNGNLPVYFQNDTTYLQASVTGINPVSFPLVQLNNDSLLPGDTMLVMLDSSYNMFSPGNYCFNVSAITNNDWDTTNNNISYCFTNSMIDSFTYFTNFETSVNPLNAWEEQSSGSYHWQTDSSNTPTINTGPAADHTIKDSSGFYIYADADSGLVADTAIIISPCIDISNLNNPQLVFWYHMYGSGIGSLNVDLFYDNSWHNNIFSIFGQQQTSSNANWEKSCVNLPLCSTAVKLRFRAIKGINEFGDIAIDDIAIGNAPDIIIDSVKMLCNGEQLIIGPTADTAKTYFWSKSGSANIIATSRLLTVDTAGIFVVLVKDTVYGFENSDTIQVFLVQPANSNAGADFSICAGETAMLFGTAQNYSSLQWTSTGDGSFLNPSSLNTSYFPGQNDIQTGSVLLKLTANGINPCASVFDSILIIINPLTHLSFNIIDSVCDNSGPYIFSGSPTGGTVTGYGMSGGVFNTNLVAPGTYMLTYNYTNSYGCINTASDSIRINPLPIVSFSGLSSNICSYDSIYALLGSPFGGTFTGNGITGNSFNPVNTYPGSHSIKYSYTDFNGCNNFTLQTVQVYPLPNVSFVNFDSSCCLNSPLIYLTGNPNGGTFTGNGVIANAFVPVFAGVGSHQLFYSFTDSHNCKNTDTANIFVNSLPNANAGNDTSMICSSSGIFIGGPSNPGLTYKWQPTYGLSDSTISNPFASPKFHINYTLTVTDTLTKCSATDDIFILLLNVPAIDLGKDTTICYGDSIELSSSTSATTYQWNTGATSQTIIVSPTINSVYILTISDGVCFNADTIEVNINSPYVELGNDTVLCANDSLLIDAGINHDAYIWNTGQTSQSIIASSNGISKTQTYIVTITDQYCNAIDSIIVKYTKPFIKLGSDILLYADGSAILDAGYGHSAYLWSNSSTTREITVDSSGIGIGSKVFTVIVTDSFGCTNSDSVKVSFIEYPTTKIPTTNTIIIYPNPSDGKIVISITGKYEELNFEIFNSMGQLIKTGKLESNENYKQETLLDLSYLAQGKYSIKFKNNTISETVEIIIK